MSLAENTAPGEIWKPDILTGITGLMLSSLGRVWIEPRTTTIHLANGQIRERFVAGRILAQYKGRRGHLNTSITWAGRECKFPVHRLVCGAFHGPPTPERPHACHDNNDPADNRPSNLRWDSARSNMRDKLRHGTAQLGERHGNARLTEGLVLLLRRKAAEGAHIYDLPEASGFARSVLWSAASGKSWKHLPHFGPGGSPAKFKAGGRIGNLNRVGGKAAPDKYRTIKRRWAK